MIRIVTCKEHIIFNKKCFDSKAIPSTLRVNSFDNIPESHRAAELCSLSFIKNRIAQSKKKLNFSTKQANRKLKFISKYLPSEIINMIKSRSQRKFDHEKLEIRAIHKTKFANLLNYKITKQKQIIQSNDNKIISKIDDSWFVNMSNRVFDQDEIFILKLDPKFAVVPKNINSEQLLANIDPKLKNLIEDKPTLENIRISIVNTLKNKKLPRNNLNKYQMSALHRLKKYDDIIITNSDKGNKTVVLEKTVYFNKINDILDDKNIYQEIKSDNTPSIAKKLIEKLKEILKLEKIDYFTYRYLYPTYYNIPNVYGIIKLHKHNHPARLICPFFEHPVAKLSKFLSDLITPSIRNSEYSLKNSGELANQIKNIRINKHDQMISLDVINLFTNIPINLTLQIIKSKLSLDKTLKDRTKLPIIKIIDLIEFCMINTSFSFNNKFYIQKSGAPMGSNLSPILGEALVFEIFHQANQLFFKQT